jgi:hypothetical protein
MQLATETAGLTHDVIAAYNSTEQVGNLVAYQSTGWSKILFAPDDHRTKKKKRNKILNSFNHLPW